MNNNFSDYCNISLVSRKWHRIIIGLRALNRLKFNDCFQTGQIHWRRFEPPPSSSASSASSSSNSGTNGHSYFLKHWPSPRHSHSCLIVKSQLFMFGGLSATNTSYNDLWILDLSSKEWHRPTASGAYPSPKAAASILEYSSCEQALSFLLLYGGYSHPYSYPFNQQVNFFDEMHFYSTERNTWSQVNFFLFIFVFRFGIPFSQK